MVIPLQYSLYIVINMFPPHSGCRGIQYPLFIILVGILAISL